MKLGPIQRKWVEDLRTYPERQIGGELGRIENDGTIKCCCLGQALLSLCEISKEDLTPNYIPGEGQVDSYPEVKKWLKEFGDDSYYAEDELHYSYADIGLKSPTGKLSIPITYNNGPEFYDLAEANDSGVPWDVIADFIENNPKAVFNESL